MGCSSTAAPPAPPETSSAATGDGVQIEDGAREIDGALTKLVLVDPATGATSVYDAVDEKKPRSAPTDAVSALYGDGRFGYLRAGERTTIVDAGAWTFDHGEHYHYFASEPAEVGVVELPVAAVAASNSTVAIQSGSGAVELFDRESSVPRQSSTPESLTRPTGHRDRGALWQQDRHRDQRRSPPGHR